MALRTLHRRANQLQLLHDACAQNASGRVRLRREPNNSRAVRFVKVAARTITLDQIGDGPALVLTPGQPVEIGFEHQTEHFRFFAVTAEPERNGPAQRPLGVSLPLRIEVVQQRQWPRLALDEIPILLLEFTHAINERRSFAAHLRNISAGGLGTVARVADVGHVHAGDLFAVRANLPGVPTHDQFVVRLVHLRPVPGEDRIALGWVLQPGDDRGRFEAFLVRLEQYVNNYLTRRKASGEN